MPEMCLRQPGFTYGARGLLWTKNRRTQKIKRKGYSRYIYQNELDKAFFLTWNSLWEF